MVLQILDMEENPHRIQKIYGLRYKQNLKKYIIPFLKFKIKIRKKTYNEKIQYFFDAFETNKTVNDSDIDFIDNYFLDSIANYLPDDNIDDE